MANSYDTLQDTINRVNAADREFFAKAWEGMSVPDDIREAAEHIVRAYGIRGICDPGYIANVIALRLGRGDGKSTFTR
jgi:hypothetical protein